MQLRTYLAVLSRWWWRLLLGALLAGGLAYFMTRSQLPVYRASATLFVNYTSGPGTLTYSDALLNQSLVKTFSQMASQPVVLEKVRERLRLSDDVGELRSSITVRPVRDTQLLEIAAEGNDPAEVRDIANAVALVFVEEQAPYLPAEPTGTSLRVAQPALLPTAPIGPRVLFNTALGVVLGALITLGLLALFEHLNDSVGNAERVLNATGLLALATVPVSSDNRLAALRPAIPGSRAKGQGGVADRANGYHSTMEEAFRILRANLRISALDNPVRSLLVTSASPGEGKTTTAANLAIVLAQGGQRVILVDADLRRPELHSRFGTRNREGLTTLLLDEDPLRPESLQSTPVENLRLLTSGPPVHDASELLASRRLEQRLAELGEQADILVVDSPPALAVADPVILAQTVDAVLLVADAQSTRGTHLDQARAAIEQAGGRILGVSLNKTREHRDGYYAYQPHGERREAGHELPNVERLVRDGAGAIGEGAPRAAALIAGATASSVGAVRHTGAMVAEAIKDAGAPRRAGATSAAALGGLGIALQAAGSSLQRGGSALAAALGAGGASGRTALIVAAALGGVAVVGLVAALAKEARQGPDSAAPAEAPLTSPASTSSSEMEGRPAPALSLDISSAAATVLEQDGAHDDASIRTVLDERFLDNQRSWPNEPGGTATLVDGGYRLFARDRNRFVAVGAPVTESLGDTIVTATFRKVDGPAGGRYGVVVRDQGATPRDGANQVGQFYVFVVNDAGEVGIWRRDGERWIDLLPWTPHQAVQREDATNVLSVAAVGPRLAFGVNGVEVADVVDPALREGGVGVYTSGDFNNVLVERLVVQVPPGAQTEDQVTAEQPGGEPPAATATVRAPQGFTSALLREGPSTSARVLSVLLNGTTIEVPDGEADAEGFRWVRARTSDGLAGWVVAAAVAR